MWCLYIVATVVILTLARQVMNLSDIKPLIAFDFTQTVNSSDSLVMIAGYALAPIVPLIVIDFFYYWFHRLQHAVPWLWRSTKSPTPSRS
jgi:sterol desaturase/sphingolipid hydroxylase (fatty acid hydroxylase superfamily)